MTETLTRKAYMERHAACTSDAEREALHHEYYFQFVTDGVRQHVARVIGRGRIVTSDDKWFNDIPLREWDRMEPAIKGLMDMRRKKEAEPVGEGRFLWSRSDAVCIAKAAAREMRDAAQTVEG